MLNIEELCIISLLVPLTNIMMVGDFNFPEVDWANFNSNSTQINMLQSFANNLFLF